jgi:uncharacterized protein YndB with AHSA1/START domain
MAKEQMTTQPALLMKRTFQATREKVFRAWTDAGELARWFAPSPEYSTVVPELDLKVGGKYILEMRHKGGNVHRHFGTYREIVPPEKVVFTWRRDSDPSSVESLVTILFRDLGPATEILLTHELLPDAESRGKHEQGWKGCLEQLDGYLNK